ncbi:MAG: DUF3786 domain-containing protein [Desulfobacteria bacterium]
MQPAKHCRQAEPEPLSQNMVSVQEFRDARFFQGSHELKVGPLLQRYGNDVDGFKRAAERLGGEGLELADAAYGVWAFPKMPMYYLLWKGDQEFEPRLSILWITSKRVGVILRIQGVKDSRIRVKCLRITKI